jgi:enoyl-CoA hydratase
MYETLKLTYERDLCILTLDAPEKRNAMTPRLTQEFPAAISEVSENPDVRVLILAANGPVFCAGGDLETLSEGLRRSPEENRRFQSRFYHDYLSLLHLDVPTIAALRGHAIGAGLCMALACDMRIAADESMMGVTFLNLGLYPGMGATHLLPLLVGSANAAELIFTGRQITGKQAERIGLVNRSVPAEQVMAEALALAEAIALKAPGPLRMAKRALVQFKLKGLEAALDYEAVAQTSSFASTEMREAVENLRNRISSR